MKKLLFPFLFLLLFTASAYAQTEKGTTLIGGSGMFHFNTEDGNNPSYFTLSPRVGFFIVNNFAIGAGIPIYHAYTDVYSSTSLGLSPFVRGYFGTSATRFLLEAKASFNQVSYELEDGMYSGSGSEKYSTYGIGAGVNRFLNEHVGLELIVSYDQTSLKENELNVTAEAGVNFTVGFQIFLPHKN